MEDAAPRPGRFRLRAALVLALLLLAGPTPAATATESAAEAEASPPGTVVLLHGLGRSERSMRYLERRLGSEGYRVENLGYASTEEDPEALLAHLDFHFQRCCRDAVRVHFVTHSLGGILARAYLAERRPPNLGRMVMLAPPNHGSVWVDRYGELPLFERVLGPTAASLGTDAESLPQQLEAPHYELGVLAGSRNLMLPWRSGDTHDGAVAVESAKVAGMADFRVLPETHISIKRDRRAADEVVHFLRHGCFATPDSEPSFEAGARGPAPGTLSGHPTP